MQEKTTRARKLIEWARHKLHSAGIDIHRFRPSEEKEIGRIDIINSLIKLRHEVRTNPPLEEELLFLQFCAQNSTASHAQLLQDLLVLFYCAKKRAGFFVEFGATDGVQINNTVLLEREYGWTGILAEPGRYWQERLRANRKCLITSDCLWSKSGEKLLFLETKDRELSTIHHLSLADGHQDNRRHGEQYEVQTVSLTDLLDQFKAPTTFDYLSIDTEGSEFDILNAFDFNKYDIRIITVEHNYTPNRARLNGLLTSNGYVRKFQALSQWDDWYVRQ